MALAWLAAAVLMWARILELVPTGTVPFSAAAPPLQAKTAALAVLYPVAAVGMWLLSAWGIIVWLAAILAQLAFAAFVPHLAGIGLATVLGNLFVGAAVLVVAVIARRQAHFQKP